MTVVATLPVLVIAVAIGYFVLPYLIRAYARYRGTRTVICPETKLQATVKIDAAHAALTSIVSRPDIRLESCSRWPLRKDCGQECLANLEGIEPDCLVQGVLMKWYRGKPCAYCGKHFTEINWIDHKPALQSAAGSLLEWSKVELSELEGTLATSLPVCWDCYITQSFRLEHPDLVVYRPWVNGRSTGAGK